MPKAIALCIERVLDEGRPGELTQCVAVERGLPGLGLSSSGEVLWQSPRPPAMELSVDEHERLVLRRLEGAPRVVLNRAGRALKVILDASTVVLDDDVIELLDRRLLVHIHGSSPTVSAPRRLTPSEPAPPPRAQAPVSVLPSPPSMPPPPTKPPVPSRGLGAIPPPPPPAPLCRYELPSPGAVAAWNPKRPQIAVGCDDGTLILLERVGERACFEQKVSLSLFERSAPRTITWCVDGFFLGCRSESGEERFLSLGDDGELPPEVQWASASARSHDGRLRAELLGHQLLIFEG